MAELKNTTPIQSPVTPGTDDRNTWPTHYAKYGAGGFLMVENNAERDAIPPERLINKMVYVKDAQKFQHHNGSTWTDTSVGNGTVPQSVLDDIAANKTEISRLKTHPGTQSASIFSYRGGSSPTLPPGKSGYYITIQDIGSPAVHIDLPSGSTEGTVVSIDNMDKDETITFSPSNGETLDGVPVTDETIDPNNMIFLVRGASGWVTGFDGLVPKSLDTLVSAIKTKLTGSLHTIDDIKAALKDRLHTFNEIANEGFITGVWVGQTHGSYLRQKVKEIQFHSPINVTYDKDHDTMAVAIADVFAPKSVEDEVNRLKTNIGDNALPTFAWRGSGIPTIPPTTTTKYKAYYIHSIVLKDSTGVINIPAGTDVGTIFSVENNDRTDYLNIAPPAGETINGKTGVYKANFDTLNFFVKDGTDWVLAYGGVFPNSLAALKSTIQVALPNSLNTIDEIAAQLKDRLHTFREIQTEFDSQLHTLSELESNGFEKSTYLYGFVAATSVPSDATWVINQARIYEPTNIPAQNKGQQHVALAVPIIEEPLIKKMMVNNAEAEFTSAYYAQGIVPRHILITNDTFDTTQIVKVQLEIGIEGSTAAFGGIEIDDGTSDVASVAKINTKGLHVTGLPNQGTFSDNEIELTAGPSVHMMAPNQQYGLGIVTEFIVEPPLNVFDDPDSTNEYAVRLGMQHGIFEPLHKPGFLAYLKEDEEVVGKIQTGSQEANTAKSHHDGAIWFDDIVKPTGVYLSTDRPNKSYSIQEADQLDPNVSGGTDYLIAFRAHMKGNAPDDGFVRIYIYNKSIDPFEPTGYLQDKQGNPMVMQKNYKAGQELGSLDLIGIVNAKGDQSFSCHVVDNFQDDILILTDRTEGATGLMIQALTSESKTGDALQQFELDTNQNIEFSSHYLGVDRMNLGYINSRPENPVSYTAGTHFISVDGYRLINYNGLKVGVVDGHTHIQDDGVHVCDFNFGKVFSAEETQMLRGKDIEVTVTLTDQHDGYRIGLMKWVGIPDKFTDKIFSSRNNDTLVFETSWSQADSMFITEDPTEGDHTLKHTFVVPSDANNYAIVIYPASAQQPVTLRLKELKVDVVPAFTGYIVHAPELQSELHLYYDTEYKKFVQDNQGYASLRYTINNTPTGLPMPCGEPKKGAADVVVDSTIHQVAGSGAKGGEGALKFTKDGDATISTELLVWSEKTHDIVAQTKFWWATVSPDGNTFTKIDDSELVVGVRGQTKAVNTMPTFKIQVENGDRIALFATTDQADGAYIQSNSPSAPMVSTEITFKELVASAGDDPGSGILTTDLDTDQFSVAPDTFKVSLNHEITGLDLTGFTIHKKMVPATYDFQLAQNDQVVIIPINIPSNVQVGVLSIHKLDDANNRVEELPKNYLYDKNTHEFKFSVGQYGIKGQIVFGFML